MRVLATVNMILMMISYCICFSTNSLFAVPANQEFVYFQTEQKDRLTFLLDLLNESFDVGVDNSDFREFLHQHVSLALTKGFTF